MLEYQITEEDHCRPVGSWLRRQMPSATAGYLGQLLTKGHLTVNSAPADQLQPLIAGDLIRLKESGRIRSLLSNVPPSLDILFEDNHIVCFNKPPSLAMHPAAEVGPQNLVDLGAAFLYERERAAHPHAAEPNFRLRPVNRLDRGTSGVTILAKSSTAAGIFGKLVMEERLDKLYLAIAVGKLQGMGEIAAPVDDKESLTLYRSLHAGHDGSLVALWPKTGRMHQLRRHLKHIGHPILGDRRYGGPLLASYPGFALHSFRTRFVHPVTGRETVIHAPLPEEYLNMLKKICGESYFAILQRFAAPDQPPAAA